MFASPLRGRDVKSLVVNDHVKAIAEVSWLLVAHVLEPTTFGLRTQELTKQTNIVAQEENMLSRNLAKRS